MNKTCHPHNLDEVSKAQLALVFTNSAQDIGHYSQ